MRKVYISLLILTGTLLANCATHKRSSYVYPNNIPDVEKEKLYVIFEKGRKLYEPYCSECHGIFTKGKGNIPNFSVKQIDSYTSRYLKGDPKNHAVAAKMDPDQLNAVFMYLRYRKIKGKPAVLLSENKDTVINNHG